jgi:hypothetical protein
VSHREHLKAAGVRDDRAVPAHELVQAAQLGHELMPRRQEEVEGVAEHHLVAQGGYIARLQGLDRAPGGQRNERGGLHRAVRELEGPAPRPGLVTAR